MNDWNGNEKYDMSDRYVDCRIANSGSSYEVSSDWWKWVFLTIVVGLSITIWDYYFDNSFYSWVGDMSWQNLSFKHWFCSQFGLKYKM